MRTVSFDDKQLIESVRFWENSQNESAAPAATPVAPNAPFENKLFQRASQIATPLNLNAQLASIKRRFGTIITLFAVITFVIGALAAGQAFTIGGGEQRVNFFWLLLILLGLDLLAICAWLFFLCIPTARLRPSLLQRSALALTRKLARKGYDINDVEKPQIMTTLASWLQLNGKGSVGFWRFSTISHGLWLSYLVGGLAAIVIMLATRQFNFVWETTILGQETFTTVTQILAWLPEQCGFATPTKDAILASQLGNTNDIAAQTALRSQWAGLLIGSILLYGCVLRAILWVISLLMLRRAKNRYNLPLTDTYYIRLRHQLAPAAKNIGIIDPDEAPVIKPKATTDAPIANDIPASGLLLAIELDPSYPWPPSTPLPLDVLGHANDRESQKALLAALGDYDNERFFIAVDFWRTADRGIQRVLKDVLTHHPKDTWLILLHGGRVDVKNLTSEQENKLLGWHQVAATLAIPQEQLLPIPADNWPQQLSTLSQGGRS